MSITINRDEWKAQMKDLRNQLKELEVSITDQLAATGVSAATYWRVMGGKSYNEAVVQKLITLRDTKKKALANLLSKV